MKKCIWKYISRGQYKGRTKIGCMGEGCLSAQNVISEKKEKCEFCGARKVIKY